RNALFFSARQRRAALTDHRFISIGKSHNEVVTPSLFRSFYNFFLRCTWIAETDVVFNGIVEQVDLLNDHRDIAEQTVTGHVPHILTAYCDLAAVHIIETGNQVANRGLAAARWPYNGRSAALGDGKADIPQNRNFIVGECHIMESNVCV